ncbi:FGGY-family carbohydrate kinase [Feifania hominis]|uniref:FGGY-family carbohydrate kinase n=1 Tax=Feifania hominis TaxID=2763660 RepID=A0A926HUP9_9FIRM|nr:FGGY-family carbohydrate kinase [Feifania hominis]MBC8535791.1 FGGY-family carbohydrate kinase [Feifania hominis]
MEKTYFLGVDVGTYESKGSIMDGEGNLIAKHAVGHKLLTPKPGWCEHDAEQSWWGDLCVITRALFEKSGLAPTDIAAVGTSVNGGDVLPVDRDCKPLRNAILYGIDTRNTREIAYLNDLFERENVSLTRRMNTTTLLPKALWIKNNEPEIYKKTYKLIPGATYLVAKLTGNFVMDYYTCNGWSPLYRHDKLAYDETVGKLVDIPRDKLADFGWTTDIAGKVTKEAAQATGLAEGTPVIVGTIDAPAEAVSTGVYNTGSLMVMLGSSTFFILVTDEWKQDDLLSTAPFIFPDTYMIAGGTSTSGTLTRWFRDNIFFDAIEKERETGRNAYDIMMDEIEGIPAGSDGLICLPYFVGERTPIQDPKARGVFFGLNLNHTRAHLYKSALEGISYAIAQHFDIWHAGNSTISKVMAVGGGTKNPPWLQMISDVTGETIHTSQITVGASYGDCMLAGLGVGYYRDRSEFDRLIKPGVTYSPNAGQHELYKPLRKLYDELYPATKELMHKL